MILKHNCWIVYNSTRTVSVMSESSRYPFSVHVNTIFPYIHDSLVNTVSTWPGNAVSTPWSICVPTNVSHHKLIKLPYVVGDT